MGSRSPKQHMVTPFLDPIFDSHFSNFGVSPIHDLGLPPSARVSHLGNSPIYQLGFSHWGASPIHYFGLLPFGLSKLGPNLV